MAVAKAVRTVRGKRAFKSVFCDFIAVLSSLSVAITAIFEDLDSKTKLTLQIMHESIEDRRKHEQMGVIEGWNSTFDCLDEFLAKA
ncbi:MAG: SRPBCC domain-containing protein [Nostoc sp. NMS7]|nr:SRPBCC domain-containing protein [Nostoc sp. NMS7]